MATRLQLISELSSSTYKKLSDYENWTAFLHSAAWQYKYPFPDQLMIYAQRPDARACASLDVWNNKLHRWINRGAKGIALPHRKDGRTYIDYVFDISDTNSFYGNEVSLWEFREIYKEAVIETLENTFGELSDKETVEEAVMSAAHNAVEDNKSDYLAELKYAKADSFLEGLDAVNIDVEFQQTAENSIAYMIFERLGYNGSEYFEREDFPYIMNFNTPSTLNLLGNAVSSISEQALREIAYTIRAEIKKNRNTEKFFAENKNSEYNVDTDENKTVDERTDNNDRNNNLQTGGRLSDTRLEASGGERAGGQIRENERNIPQAEPQQHIYNTTPDREIARASDGDRPNGEGTDRTDGEEDGADGGRERGTERERPDGMDGTDEQSYPFSRGNSPRTVGVQLSLFPLVEEQQDIISEAERLTFGSAFSVSQQIIDEVLAGGSNSKDSILKICVEFSKNRSLADKAEFLKTEYKTGGKGFIFNDVNISAWWNDKGISITQGKSAINTDETLSWEQAAKRIDELLDLGRYAPQEDLDKMHEFEIYRAAYAYKEMVRNINADEYHELKELFNDDIFNGGFGDSVAKIQQALETTGGLNHLFNLAQLLNNSYQHNKDVIRFRWYTPSEILPLIEDLKLSRKEYTSNISVTSPQRFITDDEINSILKGGSGFQDSKYRIYRYFSEHNNPKERIDFLKNEYGWGGYANTPYSFNHDGKGLTISRGDILSPFAKVTMKWTEAVKRIDSLIKSGTYLTEREKNEGYPTYLSEKHQEEEKKRIHNERTEFISNQSKLSDDERKSTLPKRVFYFIETIDNYERDFFADFGISEMLNSNELYIADCLKDSEKRKQLISCLEKIQGAATSVYDRNGAYELKNELAEVKSITLTKMGDFYEITGNDAAAAANILQLTVMNRHQNGEDIPMVGFPSFTLEKNIRELESNGYTVNLDYSAELSKMTADEKNQVIDKVELLRDYSETENLTEDDIGLYDAVMEEQEEQEEQQPQEQSEDFSQYIGMEFDIDNRKFVVDSINNVFNTVSLKDITFQSGAGFPIFRSESLEWLRLVVKQQEKADTIEKTDTEQPDKDKPLKPDIARTAPTQVKNNVVYPEIPMSERNNFVITDDELGYGGQKEKFRNNMEAIRVLKECEFDNRLATPEEQEILSRYVGWGGLSEAFDETKDNWSKEFQELYAALSPEEYEQARASTLNAHYTSPTVIKAMYKALENMGFKQGNILEPSCGIGNFMGLLPDSMSESKMYGIELDSLTGRIAQQLYQKNSVAIQGYENTSLPDSFFDVAVGNVPFGNYKLADKKYNKHNFFIHDYFFAKTLDKVRPGGIVAFITSMGTMDKKNPSVRKYIAQRADLLGAIRLPNDAFLKNANTQVTADIIFLQKRDRMTDIMPEWVNVGKDENGLTVNQYFIDNPEMVLGEMTEESSQYGKSITCKPYEDADLAQQLDGAIQNIHAQITEYEFDDISNDEDFSIPADPNVRNFSFCVVDGDIYFRENSVMHKVELNSTAENRIKGLIEIRDCVRQLIEYQSEDYPDDDIKAQQEKLNRLYDSFTKKYGLINSRGNSLAFSEDSSYFLLCSLEVIGENGELERKADIFTKRTIGAKKEISKVDTASEALAVSLAEKAKVDMGFMMSLTGKTEDEIVADLKNVIFLNSQYIEGSDLYNKYLTADEYLSGNVRQKLRTAQLIAQNDERYKVNVEALTAVQPKDLTAAEISVKLGSTWIPDKYIEQFTYELLDTPLYAKRQIKVRYYKPTAEWNISKKTFDRTNVKANNTYGTHRANAYKIIEDTLNQRDVRIFDYKENENGNKVAILNVKETAIAQQKQETIKQAFVDWVWKDPERREELVTLYNERFNSNRPREYDGSHITFSGMNPEIKLRQHQKNAVARIMYGGNSLLGHVVGAGKTWTMVAAAMESKRLGLCNKSLFVVPNHLTEQWASEFLQLYPAANILVATKKDFEMKNRKKFCGRIATGDYDAVIIGHSQFEKIPMSAERQIRILSQQIDDIMVGIAQAKADNAERFTVKQMEKTKRNLEMKLQKLNDQTRKDDVVTFEELGVDRVFVDEAHFYKNLFLYTKMRNVGGIAQTEAQKSSDLFMKSRYLDEITGGKGLIFATGTPISNSMVEMYTMQRYLQYGTLAEKGLQQFDAWASTFGETVTAIELAPEGTGYRAKTRFAKFFNLPELMSMFKEVADIQTADMLKLPVPEAVYHNVAVESTEIQKEFVADCGERAESVRKGEVEPTVDNMLKITNDGRKIALDQRMQNPMLPDDDRSKVNQCIDNVYDIWEQHKSEKSAQLVFCDMSTPKNDGSFNVYDDIRKKLIERGVPEDEIEFIHNADTEVKKKELFSKVRKGDVRILLGSTAKMGAGTNVQKRLIASHDLDCPWRPADLEQRAGRIIRQGNTNDTVHIYRYVTKDTFDSYMWQTVENKQKFISQIMTSKSPVRSAEDIDETALSYAEIKALATGNPHIKEKMELDTEVSKLKLIKSSFQNEKYALEDRVLKYYPKKIAELNQNIQGYEKDIVVAKQHPKQEDKFNTMTIGGFGYFDKKKAGEALIERCKKLTDIEPVTIGDYRGFTMMVFIDSISKSIYLELKNEISYKVELGADAFGNIQRLDNAIDGIPGRLEVAKDNLADTKKQYEAAKIECKKDFPQEQELKEKLERLAALDALLNMDKKGNEGVVMGEPDEAELPLRKRQRDEMER